MIRRPMFAARCDDPAQLRYPLLATPKIDGIRCLKLDGKVLTRSLKPVRNRHVAELVSKLPDGLDGELVSGENFQLTASAVMSADGKPEFKYLVFDTVNELPYKERVLRVERFAPFVEPLLPTLCSNADELLCYEERCLDQGYEGVVVRDPDSPYKQGRSSLREGYMVKLKRYQDSEAIILGFKEASANFNEPTLSELGYQQRKGGMAGRLPKGTLGSFLVRDISTGIEFSIGTGMDDALRQQVWDNRNEYIGTVVKYSFQACGVKDKPRFPSFLGFREVGV